MCEAFEGRIDRTDNAMARLQIVVRSGSKVLVLQLLIPSTNENPKPFRMTICQKLMPVMHDNEQTLKYCDMLESQVKHYN